MSEWSRCYDDTPNVTDAAKGEAVMRELSLFTGAGGGLLGTMLLGWTPVGYVEFDDYAQRIIRQRIDDGILPNAPIFGDIRTFIGDGYAASYTGLVDVVTGGFPCQPFSRAGKQLAADDPRNMWPATIDTIRLVRPKYAFLENVPGLLTTGYFSRILGDLAESGYGVRWRILSAAEMGAPHKRDRLWIVAYAHGARLERRKSRPKTRLFKMDNVFASRRFPRQLHNLPQPAVFGSGHGVAHYVERIRVIGNGQVPIVAATAWRLLTEDLE